MHNVEKSRDDLCKLYKIMHIEKNNLNFVDNFKCYDYNNKQERGLKNLI